MKTTSVGSEQASSPTTIVKPIPTSEIPPLNTHLPPKVADVPNDVLKNFPHSKRVGNYLLGRTLGQGSFAKVKEGLHVLTGEKVAIKVVDKKRAKNDYVRKNMRREGKLLQMTQHPNIVQLYDIMETENSYYLVTELCKGGDFLDYICQKKKLEELEVNKYIRQIISAVDYLHRLGILHRDLKVENLLLDDNKDLKIIDFGLSNNIKSSITPEGQKIQEFCVTQCGSPAYAAPELLGHKNYGPKVDAWSIGVNMYAMLTGSLPFTVDPFNIKILYNKMLTGQMNPLPEYLSKECRDFVMRLLIPTPDKRMSLSEALKHPWLSEGRNKPLDPSPCPNRAEDINDDILQHMGDYYGYRISDVIKHVTNNIPGPSTAMYHLFKLRLDRYLTHQRVRGKIPSVEVKNRENNRFSIILKESPMGSKRVQLYKEVKTLPVKDVPISHPDMCKPQTTRPGKVSTKEDTIEPKIIQLQISQDISVDVSKSREPRQAARTRLNPKLKKKDSKLDSDKTTLTSKNRVENDVIITDITNGDTTKTLANELQNGQFQHSSNKKKLDGGTSNEESTFHFKDFSKNSVLFGAKNPRTILSELLPKNVYLRHRMQKRITRRNGVVQVKQSEDNDNNNNPHNTTTIETNIGYKNRINNTSTFQDKPEKDESVKVVQSLRNDTPSARGKAKSLQMNYTTLSTSETKGNKADQSYKHFVKKTKVSKGGNEHNVNSRIDEQLFNGSQDTKKLIDICYTPVSRINVRKSAGLGNVKNGSARHLINPKQLLVDKYGFLAADSKALLQTKSPGNSLSSSPTKLESFEMESIELLSPKSSTDSKSSRSATNHSYRSTSTRSSNVALPYISISPTARRTNNRS